MSISLMPSMGDIFVLKSSVYFPYDVKTNAMRTDEGSCMKKGDIVMIVSDAPQPHPANQQNSMFSSYKFTVYAKGLFVSVYICVAKDIKYEFPPYNTWEFVASV